MIDKVCLICKKPPTQKCHVKDKSEFDDLNLNHDYFNVIGLCPYCHYALFDQGMVAIVLDRNSFLILYDISSRDIKLVTSDKPLNIKEEYVEWKNLQCHQFLKARLFFNKY